MISNQNEFGREIQRLRREQGLSIRDLVSKLGEIGKNGQQLSPSYISKIELRGEIPQVPVIIKLAQILRANERNLLNMALNNKIVLAQSRISSDFKNEIYLYRQVKHKDK